MKNTYFSPFSGVRKCALWTAAVFLGSPIGLAHGPTGSTFVAPLPELQLNSQLILASLIGPKVGKTIAHTTLDIEWESNGVFPPSELLLEFEIFVNGGTQKSWIVTGSDLGWGAGAGTYFGQLDTDDLNGVAWHFLAPDAIIDFTVATASGTGGVTGKLTNSTLTFDLGTAWESYCTAGTSASGCNALVSASGLASATASSGFMLSATGIEGGKDGLFFFGTNGRQANSWGSGTSFQCVTPPVGRAGLLSAVGTPGACDGSFAQDLNARWSGKPAQNPGAGALVQAQLWYRDPLNTSNRTTSLSDALEFPVAP